MSDSNSKETIQAIFFCVNLSTNFYPLSPQKVSKVNQKFAHRFPLNFGPVPPPPGLLGSNPPPHGLRESWETMQEGVHHLGHVGVGGVGHEVVGWGV